MYHENEKRDNAITKLGKANLSSNPCVACDKDVRLHGLNSWKFIYTAQDCGDNLMWRVARYTGMETSRFGNDAVICRSCYRDMERREANESLKRRLQAKYKSTAGFIQCQKGTAPTNVHSEKPTNIKVNSKQSPKSFPTIGSKIPKRAESQSPILEPESQKVEAKSLTPYDPVTPSSSESDSGTSMNRYRRPIPSPRKSLKEESLRDPCKTELDLVSSYVNSLYSDIRRSSYIFLQNLYAPFILLVLLRKHIIWDHFPESVEVTAKAESLGTFTRVNASPASSPMYFSPLPSSLSNFS